MFDNLKQNIPVIQIFIGYAIYIALIVLSSLPTAILWILFNSNLNQFELDSLVTKLCIFGFVVSLKAGKLF